MNCVVPWADLVGLVTPFAPHGRRGRPPFAVETMLRLHFMQQWFRLSDPAMEEALHDVPLYREFAGLDNWTTRLPDESTILRFRHLNAPPEVTWHVAMRPSKRAALDKSKPLGAMINEVERIKAGIRAKVEHPFRVIKRQFGFVKVRYRGLKKNTAQLTTLFSLSNLWRVRGKLMAPRA